MVCFFIIVQIKALFSFSLQNQKHIHLCISTTQLILLQALYPLDTLLKQKYILVPIAHRGKTP